MFGIRTMNNLYEGIIGIDDLKRQLYESEAMREAAETDYKELFEHLRDISTEYEERLQAAEEQIIISEEAREEASETAAVNFGLLKEARKKNALLKEQLAKIKNRLCNIAYMPNYDQDDALRLRTKAQSALYELKSDDNTDEIIVKGWAVVYKDSDSRVYWAWDNEETAKEVCEQLNNKHYPNKSFVVVELSGKYRR